MAFKSGQKVWVEGFREPGAGVQPIEAVVVGQEGDHYEVKSEGWENPDKTRKVPSAWVFATREQAAEESADSAAAIAESIRSGTSYGKALVAVKTAKATKKKGRP